MQLKVSVIVPVYNPGQFIEPCVDSLLAQTMPADELELIFVNDGSTDDSLSILERYASDNPQLQIITIPNSGWPGKPRNVGIDTARGTYVMFVDQDDRMDPEALTRMYELGHANGADVILGKVISDFRGVHHALYREQRPRCNVFTAQLMNSLTPHKMLRTEFLRTNGIRYPEGRRRLEDQLFMTKAYFAADAATIVADYVCYRYLRRPDGGNAGSARIDPAGYYVNLAEVLDVVDKYTAPGKQRDDFYRRFLRTEMLGRLGNPNLLQASGGYGPKLLSEVRTLAQRRFPSTVDNGLPAGLRVRAVAARRATLEQIVDQARRLDLIKPEASVVGAQVSPDGTISLSVEVRVTVNGKPLWLEADDKHGWLLPLSVCSPIGDPEQRAIGDPAQFGADLVITHREQRDEWFVASKLISEVVSDVDGSKAQVLWRGTAVLDPNRAAGGDRLRTGTHDLTVRVDAFGLTRNKRLFDEAAQVEKLPILVDTSGRIIRLYTTDFNNVSVHVGANRQWLRKSLEKTALLLGGADLTIDVPIQWSDPPARATLALVRQGHERTVCELELLDPSGGRWRTHPSQLRLLRRAASYERTISLLDAAGDVIVSATLPPSRFTTRTAYRRGLARVRRRGRKLARSVFNRLPHHVQRFARDTIRARRARV